MKIDRLFLLLLFLTGCAKTPPPTADRAHPPHFLDAELTRDRARFAAMNSTRQEADFYPQVITA